MPTPMTPTRFALNTEKDYDELKAMPQEIADTVGNFRQRRLSIASDARLSPQASNDDLAALREHSIAMVNTLVETAQIQKAILAKFVAEVFGSSGDVNAQLLEQVQQQRMWDRQRRLLDAGMQPKDLIRQAGASGDCLALRTLREELPYYGLPSGVGAVRSSADNYSEVPGLLEAIDQAELPLLSEVEQKARALMADVERGFANAILTNQNSALYEMQGKGDAFFFVDWTGEEIDVPGSKVISLRGNGSR